MCVCVCVRALGEDEDGHMHCEFCTGEMEKERSGVCPIVCLIAHPPSARVQNSNS